LEFEQKSAEWYRIRAGIPTASSFSKIVTPSGQPSRQAQGLMNFLLAEYVLGRSLADEQPQTFWMERGADLEASAVKAYEFHSGLSTTECAIVTSDDGLIAASPDRLVDENGVCEIKCPSPQVHVGRLLNNEIESDYKCQLQGQLWIMEREWVDIVSYHPQMPPCITRVNRDEDYIEVLSRGVRAFVNVMLERRLELERRFGPFTRPEPPQPKQRVAAEDPFGVNEADVEEIIAALQGR
jgi:hypothetical protein